MGLWDKLKGELIDIIEFIDDTSDTMVYRFERYGNEIKNGAKLIVRESQVAVFVNEGRLADVFQPGSYELETKNIPILSTLMGWAHGFNSPFKAEVYFVNTKQFRDLKWGTKNPIMLRDPEFGPIRLRAFGTYAMKVTDAPTFLREVVGTDGDFTQDEITNQLRNIIVPRFTDALGEAKVPALDLASNYNEIGDKIHGIISPEFAEYGISLTKLLIENISLPEAVQEALDKRSSMGIIGNMQQYTQYQAANAMEAAAENPGGMAAGGMGMGMGMAMANQMTNAFNQPQQQAPQAAPPPLNAVQFFVAVNGQQTGPFPMQIIQQKIQTGEINQQTMVWKQGMAAWTAAGQVPEISGLFGQVPPPPPPPPPQG